MSICFQADADLKFSIVSAVRQQEPAIDFASAADAELEGVGDPEILERAANEGRILVTHDRRTMLAHFRARLASGKSSPGLFVVSQGALLRPVVSAIILILEWCSLESTDLSRFALNHPHRLFRQ